MNLVDISVTTEELVALWKLRHINATASPKDIRPAQFGIAQVPLAVATESPIPGATGKFAYELLGDKRRSRSAITAYIDILTTLSSLEPTLPEQLSRIANGNSRNHIARSPAEVYPARPDLTKCVRKFAEGWFAGTNISNRDKKRILRLACMLLELRYGVDIVFESR